MTKARTNDVADSACAFFNSIVDGLVIEQKLAKDLPKLPAGVVLSGGSYSSSAPAAPGGRER